MDSAGSPKIKLQFCNNGEEINKTRNTNYVDDDMFSTMNDDIMENILIYLKLSDLISLSETSKEILHRVQTFALHYVSSHSRMDKLNTFFNC